jgi:hemerythrin-like domain-containing protein
MALGHNAIIRGLNSIYLQAPNITPKDNTDFINYAKCWHEVLNGHHEMEETHLFPAIEAKTGEKGIMAGNVEQHRQFPLQCTSLKRVN